MSNQNNSGNLVEAFAPPLLEDEVNRCKNKTATDIILPKAISTIVEWGCRKEPTQTLKEFLMEKHPENKWKQYSKRWTESDLKKLDEIDCSKLDTTIMFKLIPEVCDASDFGEMKNVLFEAKEIRNEDSHSPDSAAISPTALTKVRDIAHKILKQGAEIFNIEVEILTRKIEEVNKLVDQINETAKTKKEKSLDKLKKYICKEGRRDIEQKVIKQEIDKLPFSEVKVFRRDVFHPCKLLVECEAKEVDKDEEVEEVRQELSHQVLLCEKLLTFRSDEDIIISGLPGSGKSTFLKRLREDFVLKIPEIFHGLQNYDLLLYLECRDSIQTISRLLKNNFPITFENISDEDVAMEALAQIKMLICVDGIDESNENSSILLNRLIDQFGLHGRSSFIFTSRPGSIDVLCQELTDKNRPYFTVSIQPVDEELEQIAFLDRFQAKVSEINAPELIETFTGLDQFCKECLVQPVYLSLFCHLYTLSPQAVKEWTNELDVMKHILLISEKSVRERLALEQVEGEENKILSSKLLAEICNLTVLLLLEDKLVIDQKTYAKMCGNLFGARNVSYHKILSCILVSESDETSFTYLHKSHAEFLAANAILTRLTNESGALFMASVVRIAKDYTASLQQNNSGRFSNVFRFIILILVERGDNEVIQRIFHETDKMLAREKTPLSYFIELTLSCRSSETVIEAAAGAAKRVRYSLSSARHMLGATLMLRHHQPYVLTVSRARTQEPIPELEELMKTVAEHHAGRLRLVLPYSYYESSCDDYILELMTTSKVQLTQFQGCINSLAAVQGLAASLSRVTHKKKKGSKDALVFIRLPEPLQHHLAELGCVKHCLEVMTRAPEGPRLPHPRPLPPGAGAPPALTVVCSPDTSVEAIAALIRDLAPKEQRYSSLQLQRWHGIDVALDHLLLDLATAGIQTKNASSTAWSPASTVKGICTACGEGHLEEEDDGHGRCVALKLPDSRTPWSVTSRQTIAGVTVALQHRQPRLLDITLPRAAGTPITLMPLMQATAERHTGLLKLNLLHSRIDCSPADDYVEKLESSRCKLLQFRGCLESSSSQIVLASLAAQVTQKDKVAQIYVTLLNPYQHQLAKLAATRHVLDVLARPAPGDRCPCPLPSGPIRSPALTVVCGEATEEQEVMELIKVLTPENKRFHRLVLRRWVGSSTKLCQMVPGQLAVAGLLTWDSANVPRLDIAPPTISSMCYLCNEWHTSQDKGRCMKISLPESWATFHCYEMEIVTKLLPSHQPPLLTIAPQRSDRWSKELTALLEALPKMPKGRLRLFLAPSFWDWSPADHVVIPFSSSNCQITMLAACLDTERGQKALITSLKSVTEEDVALFISLTKSRQHQLAGLKTVNHRLAVRALHVVTDSHRHERPLPIGRRRPPSLTVVCTPTAGVKGVAKLIEDYAPKDKRYRGLSLKLNVQPTAQEMEDLLSVLVAAGMHTDNTSGEPRWANANPTDEARCQVCNERVHEEGRSCVRLWLPQPHHTFDGQGGGDKDCKDDFLELRALYDVNNSHRAERPLSVGRRGPPSLTVTCTPTAGLEGVAELIEDLAPEDKRYRGLALELKFRPSAEELEDLLSVLVAAGVHIDNTSGKPRWTDAERTDKARCQVCDERFHEEGQSCVRLWLPQPHHTFDGQGGGDKDCKDDLLELRALYDVNNSHRAERPLSVGRRGPPSLTVTCTPTAGLEGVAELIEDLAPEDKRYRGLALELKFRPSAQELEDLISVLVVAGVHTDNSSGEPRWTDAERTSSVGCQVCDEPVHKTGHSCVRLWLPLPRPSDGQRREDKNFKDDFLYLERSIRGQDLTSLSFFNRM